jgi:hypothetical protein
MREWTSNHSYPTRTANLHDGSGANPQNEGYFLRNNGPTATVHDDGKIDTLVGGLERDWFFARLGEPVAMRSSAGKQTKKCGACRRSANNYPPAPSKCSRTRFRANFAARLWISVRVPNQLKLQLRTPPPDATAT